MLRKLAKQHKMDILFGSALTYEGSVVVSLLEGIFDDNVPLIGMPQLARRLREIVEDTKKMKTGAQNNDAVKT
jgi:hypothetical protein